MTTKKEIKIIQVGQLNWQDHYQIAENIDWLYLSPEDMGTFLDQYQAQKAAFEAEQKAIQDLEEQGKKQASKPRVKPPTRYAALLLTDKDYSEQLTALADLFDVYEVFYGQGQEPETAWTAEVLYRKLAHRVDLTEPQALIDRLKKALFSGQYGAKMAVSDLQVTEWFAGEVSYEGNRYLVLDGNYGQDFQQIVRFRYNLPYYKEGAQDLFFDHRCGDGVETKISVQLILEGSLDHIIKEWEFDGADSLSEYHINAEQNGYLVIAIQAKGQGQLKLGPCHYRFSRCGFGAFVLGGERFVDESQEEFMSFFHPQDFKPPLCVYFSGWRSAEGFEGYGMMKAMGTPFLLICDPRLAGGSFYLGGEAFEKRVSDLIQEKLDFLGFDSSQLIMSGLSMGTFGATYHGAKLAPHAIVIGKPVFSLGEVALKEKIIRPGGFTTSLDLLRIFGSSYSDRGARDLDERFWKQFREADFSKTKFVVCYMKDEDYDATAFQKILDYTKGERSAKVVMKGIVGRHNDNYGPQIRWFVTQYYNVLKADFGREY